jgi:hypothetical protein
VDVQATDILDTWAFRLLSGNAGRMPRDFKDLFSKALRYRRAKLIADLHRQSNKLGSRDAANEASTRLEFAEAHKTYCLKHGAAA